MIWLERTDRRDQSDSCYSVKYTTSLRKPITRFSTGLSSSFFILLTEQTTLLDLFFFFKLIHAFCFPIFFILQYFPSFLMGFLLLFLSFYCVSFNVSLLSWQSSRLHRYFSLLNLHSYTLHNLFHSLFFLYFLLSLLLTFFLS